ncbi:conserved Plasmodium protein, unknown function [Plasmodium vivax]|uniref:Uncharacterized protein n=1 Tax=Plasmodium vivax TaxID=5855 RepID=A0A564ZYF7_PLAVI|nr:conserved Plasmodium protein, unknown function [Plasmodium vivax]
MRAARLLLRGRGRMCSTSTGRRDKLDALRKLSYEFYRRSQGRTGGMAPGGATLSGQPPGERQPGKLPPSELPPGEPLYRDAVAVSHSAEQMLREDVYSSQSYVLILKGLVNTLAHVREERRRRHLLKLITTFVGFFQRYVHLMNEQDVTLLLDVMAKCSIRKAEICQLLIQRLGKGEKNTLFYSLNSKSVCIILNSLHKVTAQGNHHPHHPYDREARRLTSDVFHFYILNRYESFSLGQLIIVLHSMHRYGYEKCRVAGLISYIAQRVLQTSNGWETSNGGSAIGASPSRGTKRRSIANSSVECEKDPQCNHRADEGTPLRRGSPPPDGPPQTDTPSFAFNPQSRHELILLHTLGCYNYCNNELLAALLCEVKRKLFTSYSEKEVCMFLSAVSNYLAIPTPKGFKVHVTDEESNLSENNQVCASQMVRTLVLKGKRRLSSYTKFSIATIYIILSKINFFYENKHADVFFLDKLFLVKLFPKKKKKIFFPLEEDKIAVKTVISLLFSLILNGQGEIPYYGALLDGLLLRLWGGTERSSGEAVSTEVASTEAASIEATLGEHPRDANKGRRALQLLSVQNAHLLCVVYTYLHLHNMLAQLKRTNLHFFLLLLSHFDYMNCAHLRQHVSSRIHAEVSATLGMLKKKKKINLLLTNECFVFPYYVDICLAGPWA